MSYALALSHFHCCFRSGCSDTSWCCQCSADECFVRLEFRCHGGRQQFSRALRRCFVYHLAAANNRNDREADRFDTRTHIRVLSVCPEFRQNCVLHELHCHHAWVGPIHSLSAPNPCFAVRPVMRLKTLLYASKAHVGPLLVIFGAYTWSFYECSMPIV